MASPCFNPFNLTLVNFAISIKRAFLKSCHSHFVFPDLFSDKQAELIFGATGSRVKFLSIV